MWTDKETKFLIDNWKKFNNDVLAKKLNKCVSNIGRKAKLLNLPKIKYAGSTSSWTAEETKFLTDNWNKFHNNVLAKKLNKSSSNIYNKGKELKLKKEKISSWTAKETKFLINNWNKLSNTELVKKLGKCSDVIYKKRKELNLIRDKKEVKKEVKKVVEKEPYAYKKLISNDNGLATKEKGMDLNFIKTVKKMKKFKCDFHLDKDQEVNIINSLDKRKKSVTGTVLSVNKNFVIVQLDNYKESFSVAAFYTGEIRIGG